MSKYFSEIKLFQVKPDRIDQFEQMIEKMPEVQKACQGCMSIRYMKRFYTIDGVELGASPRELTKVVTCVKTTLIGSLIQKKTMEKQLNCFSICFQKNYQECFWLLSI